VELAVVSLIAAWAVVPGIASFWLGFLALLKTDNLSFRTR
jgi:hypothetical protein